MQSRECTWDTQLIDPNKENKKSASVSYYIWQFATLKVEVVHTNEFKLQQYNDALVVELIKQSIILLLLPMK
jgi:hypothetical protein